METAPVLQDAVVTDPTEPPPMERPMLQHVINPRVWWALLGPAVRRLILKQGKFASSVTITAKQTTHFNWNYESDQPQLRRLYEAAKRDQWNATTALDWSISVDPGNPRSFMPNDSVLPMGNIPSYRKLPESEKVKQRHALTAWMLSQFLHGEQGALFAACQVTEAVQWSDAKLYGSTQVMDEGRHVEVFHRYLHEKLEKSYTINDNLFTIIDALVSDSRWDMKFLGMQIMIEGLALGAFGVMRKSTQEPLLRDLLRYVITDEARHVHYGVTALGEYYTKLSHRELREREDWAFEVAVLMRNRFLAHEFYDEYYSHLMSRRAWEKCVLESGYMQQFRTDMFRRLIPNLRRINLLSDRIKPHYHAIGLLQFERGRAADQIQASEMLD